MKILAERKAEGTAVICGEAEASFADRQLLEVATRFMTSTELLVITQDDGLSNDLLGLNRLQSVQGKRLTVGAHQPLRLPVALPHAGAALRGQQLRSGWESRSVAALIPEGPNADSGVARSRKWRGRVRQHGALPWREARHRRRGQHLRS